MTDAIDVYATAATDILRKKSKSFRLAARILAPDVRSATVVLYAYCRRCDDAIDDEPEPARAREAVERLRAELTGIYAGEEQREPVLAAFQALVLRHGIPRLYPEELIAGMHMDVSGTHYATRDALYLYCHRVAGTVGLMMCHVLGLRGAWALRHAAHLGIAMQLTNICRDVREDHGLGRVYLPASLLAAHGGVLTPEDDEARLFSQRSAIAQTVRGLLREAERFYQSADEGLVALPIRSALAVRAARLLYAAIGTRLLQWDGDALRGRAFTSPLTKALLLVRAALGALAELPRRIVRRAPVQAALPVLGFRDVVPLTTERSEEMVGHGVRAPL